MMARSSAGARPVLTSTSMPRCPEDLDSGGRQLVADQNLGRMRVTPPPGWMGIRPRPLHAPSRARAAGPRYRRSPPWRRPRCAGPAARRDRRRCRRPTPSASSSAARRFAAFAWLSASRPANQGAAIFRQIEVQERVAGVLGQESRPGAARDPIGDGGEIGLAARDQRRQAADAFGPAQPVQRVLDAEHRGRVDGLALEDALDQLAAGGQAEDLRQRPGRLVGSAAARRRAARAPACRAPPRRPAPSARTR